MRRLLLISSVLIAAQSFAQSVTIKNIELAGEKIIVSYDLDDSNPNNEYQLSLYASKDKFSAPLTKVKGDIGDAVKPGADRKVEWNLIEEYGTYKGKISLEIRGRVFVPFVKLRDFDTSTKYKRGKTYPVAWRPGNTNPIHIELYRGSQKVSGELNHPNNGEYALSIDSKVKPGKDYRLKITDSKRNDEIVYSEYFTVIPKVPFALKLVPVIAIIGGVAVLVGGKSTEKDPAKEVIPTVPLPQ
jgi:Ser-Thr-rich glycosyl-phosphatidyl-inositol-anchored membrane family